jgi:hypothetical protein
VGEKFYKRSRAEFLSDFRDIKNGRRIPEEFLLF